METKTVVNQTDMEGSTNWVAPAIKSGGKKNLVRSNTSKKQKEIKKMNSSKQTKKNSKVIQTKVIKHRGRPSREELQQRADSGDKEAIQKLKGLKSSKPKKGETKTGVDFSKVRQQQIAEQLKKIPANRVKNLNDVVPLESQGRLQSLHNADLLDSIFIVRDVQFGIGQFGEYAFVQIETPEGAGSWITSGQVLLETLKGILDYLPVRVKLIKPARAYLLVNPE